MFAKTVTVMGGCGHVGLPMAIALAEAGFQTEIYDIDQRACEMVAAGKMPFTEELAEPALQRELAAGRLHVSSDPKVLTNSQYVVCVVGTPVDEFLNPTVHRFFAVVDQILPYLREGQILMLRSTLFPETSRRLQERLKAKEVNIDVVVCPERVAQGKGFVEIKTLPQIVSGFSGRGVQAARFLFEQLGVEVIETQPLEAELVKLFNNVWRYISFATANQFFTIANDYGLDYYRLHHAMTHNYPRGQYIPKPGFAAGPCLFKDTMQLAAFSSNQFFLGHSAMLVNEGLPLYVVQKLAEKYDLDKMTIGILGMAFKANCDDVRDSLSFKLRKILDTRCQRVICSDCEVPADHIFRASMQIRPSDLLSAEELIDQSDLIVIGVPHRPYSSLNFKDKPVFDIWNALERGSQL